METQSKFLNKKYLETRLREIREIRQKEMIFEIGESDRTFSRSLYVSFYCPISSGKFIKGHTLRISDHIIDTPHTQFIIEPSACLTKKKKQQFARALETAVKKAKTKHFYKEMENISRGDEKNA